MRRRDFLSLPIGAVTAAMRRQDTADITLRIAEISWELGPKRTIRTLAYNGQIPGPLLRARAGRQLTVEVINDTANQDIVHWHGLHIPSDVDGAIEQGTPPVLPRSRRRYVFTPEPKGTRWYHSHGMAHRDLKKSTYSGQAGMLIVDGDDPGTYDQEVPIVLKEYEPYFRRSGPLDVEFRAFTINGKMAGAGEPIRVKTSERLLFRILNASATLHHRLALPGHRFRVIALDGNDVPTPATVPVIEVAPGERVDAMVEMSNPGVWWLGELHDAQRQNGMAIAIEYAGQSGAPRWSRPGPFTWDYGAFGAATPAVTPPDATQTLAFRARPDGHHWMINGKSYPDTAPIIVRQGSRQRLVFDNQSAEGHPVHLHRHQFEVVRVADRQMSGIWKDVVVVPAWKQVEVDVPAVHPGLSLFHCHQQFHMDMGFMTMLRYEP